MTNEELAERKFIEYMTGIKPEHQPYMIYVENLISAIDNLSEKLDNICGAVDHNAEMVDELGKEVFKLRGDLDREVYGKIR